MIYSSVHNERIKKIKDLNNKKSRDEQKLFLVEGEHLVKEALKSNSLKEVILLDDYNINAPKIFVSTNVMKYISNLKTIPKMIGICQKNELKNVGNKVLILDNIQDPGNLGTIIRSCVAFNVDTIILSKENVDIYNDKVIRASQGMIFKINFIIDDLEKQIKTLKNKGYKILSTDVNNGKNINKLENISKVAIIMGNEGNGVSDKLKNLSDDFLYIKMNKACESLNVAIAASIILYELSK